MDPIFVQFVQDHDDVVAVEYHTWWPGNQDPFYQHNIPENTDRTNYYGVNATPWEWVDGVIEPVWVYSYATITAAYNARKAVPTSVTLSHMGTVGALGEVWITVTASTDAALPAGDYRLQIILVENGLYWEAPNGMDDHEFIMRDMYSDAGGTSVSFSGGLPQTADVMAEFDASGYDIENCDVVYFLQNHGTKEVLQAGKVNLLDLDPPPTGVQPTPVATATLGQNYPNPFNPVTVIPVTLSETGWASLEIVDVQGRVIRTLHKGMLTEGRSEFQWDGTAGDGSGVASGVYLARFSGEGKSQSQPMVLLK